METHFTKREILLKIVYCGCAFGGKTTSLESLHALLPPSMERTPVTKLDTERDLTLFFDFCAIDLKVRDLTLRFQTYTVPGQPKYERTREAVLKGVDAIVFVADSSPGRARENRDAMNDMFRRLAVYQRCPLPGTPPQQYVPVVLQLNKRDARGAVASRHLQWLLNREVMAPVVESVAHRGTGTVEAFQTAVNMALVSRQVIEVNDESRAGRSVA